jgi:hypothetical protein
LSSEEGKEFIVKENLKLEHIDYARVLMDIPPTTLAKHRIYPGTPVYEIIARDTDGLKAPERG